jgi:beta-lactamase class A
MNPHDILEKLGQTGGQFAFYYHRQGQAPVFSANSARFPSASLIKVPILLAYAHLAQTGAIDLDALLELDSLPQVGGAGFARHMRARCLPLGDVLLMMIATSDNLCANLAIEQLGQEHLNQIFRDDFGLSSSQLQRKFMDFEARARGLDNWIGAEDCIRLFERVAVLPAPQRAWVDRLLLDCEDSSLLLRDIPRDTLHFHHKTGSVPGVLHDWGYTRDTELFLLTQGFTNESQANECFGLAGQLLIQ